MLEEGGVEGDTEFEEEAEEQEDESFEENAEMVLLLVSPLLLELFFPFLVGEGRGFPFV
jgi:hypothetical protein